MKRMGIAGLMSLVLMLMVASAGAVTLGITDNLSKTGFNIDYSLTYTTSNAGTEGDPYAATFTIDDHSIAGDFTNGPWTITGVYFKFFEGSPEINESPALAGYTWANPVDGFWGFDFGTPLVLGAGGAGPELTLSFNFWDGAFALKTDEVNFKVDYVGGEKREGGFYTGQLSDYLRISEPGAMLLLGSGLIGLVAYRRLRRMR